MEITSDWHFEGTNANRGFSSRPIWMRNPQGQRILIKAQKKIIIKTTNNGIYGSI